MEEKQVATIPYFIHESAMERLERTVKRLFVLCIILIVLAVGSNLAWLHYESQFEDVVVTQDVDSGDGGNATINDGVHINGESETDG